MLRRTFSLFLLACSVLACNSSERHAYRLTDSKTVAALGLRGDTVIAAPGDVVMRSSRAIAVIQRPLRDMGPTPYGGNLVDFALTDDRIDRFGEMQPFLNLGRTANFTSVDIISDGSDGGPAIVEASGKDALFDFVNVPAVRPDLLMYKEDGSGLLKWDPSLPVPLTFKARYTLGKDADVLTVRYTVTNTSEDEQALQAGVSMDSGGDVGFFTHERGFGGGIHGFSLEAFLTGQGSTIYSAIVADDVAYGIRPIGDKSGRPLRNVGLSIAGVGVVIATDGTLFDVLNQPTLTVPAKGSRAYAVEIQLGRHMADVRRRFLERDGDDGFTLSGQVTGLNGGGPHYAYFLRDGLVESMMPLDIEDRFSAFLPPGRYQVAVETVSFAPLLSPIVDLDADVDLTIEGPKHGHLHVQGEVRPDRDSAAAGDRPCRVAVFTAAARTDFPTARRKETLSNTFDVRFLDHCTTADEPLSLPEGQYLVQVTAGPQYDVTRTLVTVSATQPVTITPVLHRLYAPVVAADFHQHTLNSPDSRTPLEVRTLGYAAEAIDFFASSDHDRVTDYAPLIQELGLDGILQSAPGVECTTFAFGHFNAWPLPHDPTLPSGGSIDWGRETETLLPRDIFAAMKQRGAAIVQVNHPRNANGDDFQSFFDRAALVVDPDNQRFGSEPLLQPVSNSLLRLPEGEPLFHPSFEAVEIMNGFNFRDRDNDGRLDEVRADLTLRDWLGFLALGFRPAMVGVSDSHEAYRSIAGYPRTYVQTDGNASDAESVASALKGGRAVASNGPLLDVHAYGQDSGGLGSLVRPQADGSLVLRIRSEAQTPAQIDRFEVFVNTWVKTAPGLVAPLAPTVTVNASAAPVTLANGGTVYVAEVDVPITVTKDAFIVVRATGNEPLFPFLLEAGGGVPNPAATSPADFFTSTYGAVGLAYANPIFIDEDGDGAYDPPALH